MIGNPVLKTLIFFMSEIIILYVRMSDRTPVFGTGQKNIRTVNAFFRIYSIYRIILHYTYSVCPFVNFRNIPMDMSKNPPPNTIPTG